jgi:hypothetical protein
MAQIILDSNNNLIQGDFDNATLNNRTKLQTTTTNATTNVYVVPNGSSTSAGVSVANNSSLTNASKIVMATNGSTDTQIISGVNGSGSYLPLSFYTNNALAMQITTGGIISAAGGGIQFPATQIPSADANTLDDYEEGTWTPIFVGQTTAGSCTYNTGLTNGSYVKIGQFVYTTFSIIATSTHSGTGNLLLNGLPFATSSAASFGGSPSIGYWGSLGVNITYISAYTGTGSSGFQIQYSTAAQSTITTAATSLVVNNTHLIGTFVYRAST